MGSGGGRRMHTGKRILKNVKELIYEGSEGRGKRGRVAEEKHGEEIRRNDGRGREWRMEEERHKKRLVNVGERCRRRKDEVKEEKE